MYYKLLRQPPKDNSVQGKLYWTSHYINKRTGELVERLHYICDTLERLLPILCQVPGRTGIRFHRGSLPEHSRGCILVSAINEQLLTSRWLAEQTAKEETRLEICSSVNS